MSERFVSIQQQNPTLTALAKTKTGAMTNYAAARQKMTDTARSFVAKPL
jgi:hypothetical protein